MQISNYKWGKMFQSLNTTFLLEDTESKVQLFRELLNQINQVQWNLSVNTYTPFEPSM